MPKPPRATHSPLFVNSETSGILPQPMKTLELLRICMLPWLVESVVVMGGLVYWFSRVAVQVEVSIEMIMPEEEEVVVL